MAPLRLDAAGISVALDAERGGRIVGLRDTHLDREWLIQRSYDGTPAPVAGSAFTDGDMCGWDEMFPTVIACRYPGRSGADPAVELPDHGELWTTGWQITDHSDMSVDMVAESSLLPYRFLRRAAVSDSRLLLSYRVEVTGPEPVTALWAAHPQLRCLPGTRIVLPDQVRHLIDVSDPIRTFEVAWPGGIGDLVTELEPGTGRKLYAEPAAAASWAALVDPGGACLRLSWDPVRVPYLGLWLDHQLYSREPCVCLEPSTGFYDDLALAAGQSRAMSITSAEPAFWSVEVECSQQDPAGG